MRQKHAAEHGGAATVPGIVYPGKAPEIDVRRGDAGALPNNAVDHPNESQRCVLS